MDAAPLVIVVGIFMLAGSAMLLAAGWRVAARRVLLAGCVLGAKVLALSLFLDWFASAGWLMKALAVLVISALAVITAAVVLLFIARKVMSLLFGAAATEVMLGTVAAYGVLALLARRRPRLGPAQRDRLP